MPEQVVDVNLPKISDSGDAKLAYFPALTGLRAVAALLVFFFHALQHFDTEQLPFVSKWLVRLVQQGDIGVTVFFVLSGFLITLRYRRGLQLNGAWLRRYFQNRFARVYPIFFLLTVFSFAVMIVHPTYDWYMWTPAFTFADKVRAILLNLVLVRSYFPSLLQLGVPTAWSLTVEESFYLCAPLLIWSLREKKSRIIVFPIILLSVGVLATLACTYFLTPGATLQLTDLMYMFKFTFFGRCIEFIVGMGLALWLPKLSVFKGRFSATWAGVLGIVTGMGVLAIISHSLPALSTRQIVATCLVNNVLLPVPVAVLLWGLVQESTMFGRLLQTKFFDLLGKSSYAFYLIHLGIVDTIFIKFISGSWEARLMGHLLLSIALYKLVENPFNRILRAKKLSAQ